MIRHIGKVIGTSVLIALACIVGASAQENASGGVGGRPANPDPDVPRTQSIFIHTIKPGESVKDQVRLSNNSSKKQVVELLVVDGIVTNTGDYTCKQNSEAKTGIARTITLSESRVELEPGSNKAVDFTVQMPNDADVGEQNACLVFQAPQADETIEGNIRLRTRQAIRLVATVPGELRREVAITKFGINYRDSSPVYALAVKNTGNVSVDANMIVEIKNIFGTKVAEEGGQYPVLANQKMEKEFPSNYKPLLGGIYKANAQVAYNSEPGTFGLESGDKVEKITGSTEYVYIPPTSAGVAILVAGAALLAGAIVYAIRKLLHKRAVQQKWGKHQIKEGESLNSLAHKYHTEWKTLARANNIKPPYEVRAGDTIRVPKNTK